jgi:alanine racemase
MKIPSDPMPKAPARGLSFREEWLAKLHAEQRRESGEASPFSRVIASYSSQALVGNFKAISDQLPDQFVMPMIKANGYGHGMSWSGKLLANQPKLYGFGVATLEEGALLRESLGLRNRKLRIVVFSNANPWSEEKGRFCEEHGLTPVIGTDADWQIFLRDKWNERIPYELKFNTGMNRLGLSMSSLSSVAKVLRKTEASRHPSGIFSHLAMGESPESRLSRQQLERFVEIRSALSSLAPQAQFHLANSSGIWNHKGFGLKGLTDVIRPGLALYGVPPWKGAPERGIFPVMHLSAQVVAVHRLKRGESVGYGATFTVTGTDARSVAVLAAGYADGVPRALSNRGFVWLDGAAERFAGNVSMDLCAVTCSAKAKVGSAAEIMGRNVDAWAQAEAAGTIPYELLTSISSRVQRYYA